MESRLLKQLATIINYGSLTRAAERLSITQPTLTRNMQALEDRVGEAVLVRSRYGVRPTLLGTRLGEVGNRIIEEETQAEDVLRQWRQGYDYEVRIGVGPMLQFAVMNRFVETCPRNRNHVLHFKTGSASYLIPELQRGSLDLLIAPAFLDMEQSLLLRDTVFDDEVRVFAGRKSRFYNIGRKVGLAELETENWLWSGAGAGLRDLNSPLEASTQPSMIFTGAIDMVTHLLRTSDVIVRMPVRLMLISGAASAENIIDVEGEATKRDVAIWSTPTARDERAVQEVHARLKAYFTKLNLECPLYGVTRSSE